MSWRSSPPCATEALTRRSALGLAGAAVVLLVRPVQATPEEMSAAMARFTGAVPVQPGRVRLELPPLVENGNSVTLTVTVESPMTPQNHVNTIAVFTEKNPQPNVAVFRFGPRAGRAAVTTRMRLATSQRVTAIVGLSDGSFWSDAADVIVTLAACVES
jgi:sulfur-oxidizing protein SoxY